MLSGGFEDELDFFAEPIDATSVLEFSLAVWTAKDLRSGPEKKYHPASKHCYYKCMRPGSFVRGLHQGMWKADFGAVHGTVAGGFEQS